MRESRMNPVQSRLYRLSNTSRYHWNGSEHATGPTLYDNIRKHLNVKFTGNKMPKDLKGTFFLEGVKFDILSSDEKKSLIRIYVTCPECSHTFAAGRSGQHLCKKA